MDIFQKHPSGILTSLYDKKNYQGSNPFEARVLLVGRDPNWAMNIEELTIFDMVKEYLSDGVSFWKKYKIHHPFLHQSYNGEGKKYHKAISRLNLGSSFADKISFVEIIGFPTTGMSSTNYKLFNEYLLSSENKNHLKELDELFNNPEKLIFLSWGLIDYLKYVNKKTGLFQKFTSIDKNSMVRTDLNKVGNIYFHKHFSMGISTATLDKISTEIKQNLL
ncbi:hypothetical protein [Flavobacterium sp. RSSB_23]|uniref:hypothetical protein n=1 Tax=Flavobacterium sp. RSSB_23 TaxID=3447668 RepID=UPI003F3EF8A1